MTISRTEIAQRVSNAMVEAGMSQVQLARQINLNASSLSRALSGQRNFKSLEIALIAQALKVPTAYLLAEADEPPAALAARTQPASNAAVTSALALVDEILDLDSLLVDLGYRPVAALEAPGHADGSPTGQGEALARSIRDDMGLGDDDLPYDVGRLATQLEQRLGIDVAIEPLTVGLDGLSVARGRLRLALVSSQVSATRQRFTLAHELGHLAAGDAQDIRVDENLYGRRTDDERRANAFAAAFLMPAESVRAAVPRAFVSEELVSQLLGRFGVSLDALAFRLHNVGLVDATGRERIRAMSSSRIALRSGRTVDLQSRGDRRVPGNLLARAAEAYVDARISIRPLAHLLRVDPEHLLTELSPPNRPPGRGEVDVDSADLEPAL